MTLSLNCSLWAIPPPVLAPNHILSRAHHTRQRVSLTLHLFRDKAVCLRGFASEWLCIRFRTDSQKKFVVCSCLLVLVVCHFVKPVSFSWIDFIEQLDIVCSVVSTVAVNC